MIGAMTPDERLICLLGFASVHTGPLAGTFTSPFSSNYTAFQAEIDKLLLPLLNDDVAQSKAATLKLLLQTHDYVGVCVHVAMNLDGGENHPLYPALVDNCCNGTIIAASNNQASRHLAMSYLLKKAHRVALDVAEPLAARNPDWVDAQILVAQILGDMAGAEKEETKRVGSIRSAYKLSPAQEALLGAVEAEVHRRRTP